MYCIEYDTGIINSIVIKFSKNYGKLLETAVFLELKRKNKNMYYWKSGEKYEVDFLIVNGHKVDELIQVAWELEENTKKREIRSLLKAMDEFNLNSGKIITKDFQKTETHNNKIIEFIPFYSFMQ